MRLESLTSSCTMKTPSRSAQTRCLRIGMHISTTNSKGHCLASTILSLQRQLEFPTDYADSFSPSIVSLLSMPEMSLLLAGPERSPSWAERRACQQQRAADRGGRGGAPASNNGRPTADPSVDFAAVRRCVPILLGLLHSVARDIQLQNDAVVH